MKRKFIAKKLFCILITLIILLVLIGYIIIRNRPVLPPVRIGKGEIRCSVPVELYTFETAIEKADVIAHLRIGDWLGENEHSTYYKATVVEQFTGEAIEEIILIQDGSSKSTHGRFPLFTYGNELLIFLKKGSLPEYDNVYYSMGSFDTVLYAVTADSGDVYYYDRCNILSMSATGIINNIPMDSFARKLYDKLIKEDPLLEEEFYYAEFYSNIYFYSKEAFEKLINKQ